MKRIAMIYHSTDNDGLMCGFLMQKFLQFDEKEFELEFIPYNYQTNSDWMKQNFDSYYFADVTPPIDWLLLTLGTGISATIFDHHESFNTKLLKTKIYLSSNFTYYYDINKSGSKILWDYIVSNQMIKKYELSAPRYNNTTSIENIDLLVDLVNAYDLWLFTKDNFEIRRPNLGIRFNTIDVLGFNTYFSSKNLLEFRRKFSDVKKDFFSDALISQIKTGKIMNEQKIIDAQKTVKSGNFIDVNGINVFCFNASVNYFIEQEIKKQYPSIKFWLGFNINLEQDIITFAPRSVGDVSVIPLCERWGGGGHKNAGGFVIPIKTGMDLIKDLRKLF